MDKIAELEQRIARFEAVLGERFAELGSELRKRITALEAALQTCPGEACLYCGERTFASRRRAGSSGRDEAVGDEKPGCARPAAKRIGVTAITRIEY